MSINPVKKALHDLAEAAANKQVEPICSAVHALRKATDEMPFSQMLKIAQKYIGKPLGELIVSAYSQRTCFMCNKGVALCIKCDGSGRKLDDSFCKRCCGLGLTACGFCRGTGWSDRETTPPELHKAVLKKQLEHLNNDVAQLRDKLGTGDSDELKALPDDQKRKLKIWLVRLQARIAELVSNHAVDDDTAQKKSLIALASRMQTVLKIIRSSTGNQ